MKRFAQRKLFNSPSAEERHKEEVQTLGKYSRPINRNFKRKKKKKSSIPRHVLPLITAHSAATTLLNFPGWRHWSLEGSQVDSRGALGITSTSSISAGKMFLTSSSVPWKNSSFFWIFFCHQSFSVHLWLLHARLCRESWDEPVFAPSAIIGG